MYENLCFIHIFMSEHIQLLTYDNSESKLEQITSFKEVKLDTDKMYWLNVINLQSKSDFVEVLNHLSINDILIEDLVNTTNSLMLHQFDDTMYISLKFPTIENDELVIGDVSLLLHKNILISNFKDDFELVQSISTLFEHDLAYQKNKPDYLMYRIIDALVQHYFVILEAYSDKIDDLEDRLLIEPSKQVLHGIYEIKRELIEVRRLLWPLRNMISNVELDDNDLVLEHTHIYFKNVYNNVLQLIDIIETYYDVCSGMLDTYLSSIGNRTNDIMKVLTIYSTIFIPLSFLAGVYGMNFSYLPELHFKYSYLIFWIICILLTLVMLRIFKKKGWL